MGDAAHIFPAPQAEYLRAMKAGRYRPGGLSRSFPSRVSLIDLMPPVYQQAMQGSCVASAVTALLEYYWDCKTRLSVQYLYMVTREIEREGLERNLAALRAGETLDPRFEALCHAGLLQLRMLADANGGLSAPAVQPFLARFEEGLRARLAEASGSLLMSCFAAVETRGVCRYSIWPYAAARATPLFGAAAAAAGFPPGSHEDAAGRRVTSGLYLLGTPNNVDEIRAILSGSNARRQMPVAVTVDFFEGCDGETYTFPGIEEAEGGAAVSANRWLGRHGLLVVGYEDDPSAPGGGYFLIRNSLGAEWGSGGYGRMPYAYLECFAVEAGTILQSLLDYEGDGYGGQRRRAGSAVEGRDGGRRLRLALVNLAVAVALVAATWVLARSTSRPARRPFVEVTIYGRGGMNEQGVLMPWNVKGVPIDGGYVYTLPAANERAVDEIRTVLGRMNTLHEKRGKPLTYDLISLFSIRGGDRDELKRVISGFMADGFPVRIRESGPGGMLVATLNPRALRGKMNRLFKIEDSGGGEIPVWTVTGAK